MRNVLIAALLAVVAVSTAVVASDWPQFLGPARTGVSDEKGLVKSLDPAPKELWKAELGEGFGGPAIQGGKVYILDRKADKDVLRCIDLAGGKEEWTYSYDAPGKVQYPGSRPTPAIDDKNVYTVGPFGDVYCIDKAKHEPVWKMNLLKDFGGALPRWGVSDSPLLYKDWVILAPQGTAGLIAVQKSDGKVVWKSDSVGKMAYASPVLAKVGDVEQFIIQSADKTTGVAAADGKILWTYDGWKSNIPVPSVVVVGDGKFFITGGYKAGCAMFKVEKSGDAFAAKEVFKNKNMGAHLHTPLLYDGNLYANSDDTGDGLVCMDLDGNVKWKSGKDGGLEKGGILIADGVIFGQGGASGDLLLFEASPKEFKSLGKTSVGLSGPNAWAPMALSDGKLVLRDQKQLKCLDVAKK